MSHSLAEYMRLQKRADRARPERRELSPEERRALHMLRKEARAANAQLHRPGRGSLPPSTVLAVFRRDGYRCREGCDGPLTVHHRTPDGGNRPENLETLCVSAHDRRHS